MIKQIQSRKNPEVARLDGICREPSAEAFVLQGDKFISDASGIYGEAFLSLITTDPDKYPDVISRLGGSCEIFHVSEPVMEKLSRSVSRSSLLAVMKKPRVSQPDRLLVLDGVQDPGNVGSIIRTAHCFGFGVVCGENCANPFSAKAVRSTAGAVCGCFVESVTLAGYIDRLRSDGYTVYGSALSEKALPLPDARISGKTAIIIGSEGKGIRPEILALTDKPLYIPIKNVDAMMKR